MASKLLIITVFILDLVAFGLAIAAERRRSTARIETNKVENYDYCVYESDISTGYGVGAFLLLLACQALVMVASRCFCCGKALRPGGSRSCALLLFFLCWVSFFIAEVLLLAGSVRNAYHTKYRSFRGTTLSCETVRKGIFAAGAAFIFLTGILSEFYYTNYSKAKGGAGVGPHSVETGGAAGYR
ncbi:hypothetical protein DM860_008649 [Cuscuta australis]|uniref:Fiber protein Fb34 n=1 Tax=Cuscuta australis TaxID=267555 RepID=A0A328D9G4_9ASTE|nr:hypothetical protein DM860_008649 [Cuscuta australis]